MAHTFMTLDVFKKKELPDEPGVYFFLGKRKELLYIGKATALKSRVRSYFSPDIIETRGRRIQKMVEEAKSIDWRVTDSVLEALILEASLIKSHKPKYNVDEKDDKSFNYVVFTKEALPRVLLVRGKELPSAKGAHKAVFGPFPHGNQLKEALRLIRKIFPYRDICTPCEKGAKCKPCFNRQIGLCPGVCSGEVTAKEYARTVRHLTLFFQAKKKALVASIEKEMRMAAKEERFEDASMFRKQLFALAHIQDVSLIKEEYKSPEGGRPFRIEAYDIAHFMGGAMVGVMTVVEGGMQQPAEYRKFRIKSVNKSNDPAALKEVLSRRLGHDEWPMPRLIVVDGSTAQMNAAEAVLAEVGVQIPIVGVVKDEHHRPKRLAGDKKLIKDHDNAILLANSEAHRFAINYHRRQLRKKLL